MTAKLPGSSYELCYTVTNCVDEQHTTHISPFPHQLLLFAPIGGPDNRYDQMHALIKADPYKEASIKGFLPYQPYQEVPDPITFITTPDDCKFPSLAELNDEMFLWQSAG